MSKPLREPVRFSMLLPADLLARLGKFQHAKELANVSVTIRWMIEDCLARFEARKK